MDLSYGHEYDAFREEVKSFIRSNKHKQPKTGDGIKSQPQNPKTPRNRNNLRNNT